MVGAGAAGPPRALGSGTPAGISFAGTDAAAGVRILPFAPSFRFGVFCWGFSAGRASLAHSGAWNGFREGLLTCPEDAAPDHVCT